MDHAPPRARAGNVRKRCRTVGLAMLTGLAAPAALCPAAAEPPKPALRTERFDRDPGWEGLNNRVVPTRVPTVTQDFGYSPTNFAGRKAAAAEPDRGAGGELGGRVTRTMTPAYYADALATPRTLDDKLSASGTFALTAASPGGGVFFGWFNAKQQPGGGRPMNSLGLHLDTESKGGRLAVRLLTGTNQGAGTFVTPYEQYRTPEQKAEKRPTPIKVGTVRYAWALDYDPTANGGDGQFRFTIKGDGDRPEPWEGKPFAVDLPPGYRKDGATFDRFGLANMTKPGGSATIYFDDLRYDGKAEDFGKDPGWAASGNRARYEEPVQVGAHDFGFSPRTSLAGGAAGEVGGNLWRSGDYGYYADRVGPLTLDDRLEARGKVMLSVGAPDADMFVGWFDGASKDKPPTESGSFVGVHVGGPTRVGHYFHPSYATAKPTKGQSEKGPVLAPGVAYEWSLVYDPAAAGGKGTIAVTLGTTTETLVLKEGCRRQGGRFDRFGLFTSTAGGQLVRIHLDDLSYTAARPAP